MSWLVAFYPWIKAFHIISVVAWLAGLLYLPRLFVYHAGTSQGSEASAIFKVMERRVLRGIMNPAMIAVFVFGALLVATPGIVDWASGWVYVKLVGVAGLVAIHHLLGRCQKAFAEDRNARPARFYRIVNEVPTAILILIVILVVVKPF